MTFILDNYEILVVLWSYLFIYNLALFILFFTLFQFINFETKTLFSFSDLGSSNILTKILLVTIFSMAGVPPFWGFFAKMFIFVILTNSNFFFFFFLFFIILFISLYFYIQNIRFLNSSSLSNISLTNDIQLRTIPYFYYFSFSISFLLIFGFYFTEDLFIFFHWIII